MPNRKSYQKIANFRKRKRRREGMTCEDDFEFRTYFKELPTIREIKDALRDVRHSSDAVLRLAALMDNLSAYCSPRYVFDERCYRERTDGIRKYLAQDGYLLSRYKTLMRYKKLGELIRAKCGFNYELNTHWGYEPNLLWGFDDTPFDEELDPAPREALRALYKSLDGMNFKQILNKVQ